MSKLYEEYLNQPFVQEFVITPLVLAVWSVYKRYYSAAAIYCKSKKGNERRICVKQYKIRGLQKAKRDLNKFKNVCRKYSSNIPKCLSELDKHHTKIDKKIKEEKNELAELMG